MSQVQGNVLHTPVVPNRNETTTPDLGENNSLLHFCKHFFISQILKFLISSLFPKGMFWPDLTKSGSSLTPPEDHCFGVPLRGPQGSEHLPGQGPVLKSNPSGQLCMITSMMWAGDILLALILTPSKQRFWASKTICSSQRRETCLAGGSWLSTSQGRGTIFRNTGKKRDVHFVDKSITNTHCLVFFLGKCLRLPRKAIKWTAFSFFGLNTLGSPGIKDDFWKLLWNDPSGFGAQTQVFKRKKSCRDLFINKIFNKLICTKY